MTLRSFMRDIYRNNMAYITNFVNNETHLHITRQLRNKYKINIVIIRPGWTHEIFETYYFPDQKKVVVLDYNFKLIDPSVLNTYSLKYCGKEQVYDYYLKYIDTTLMPNNVFWN